ncbi:HD domain-containing protein [bacterium]|nr:HD domain-containing protein [bacterium]
MRIVNINKVVTGQLLGKSLFNSKGKLLLAAGYELTNDILDSLKSLGYNAIFIMDELSEDIVPEEVIEDSIRQILSQKVAETFEGIKNNPAFEAFAPENIKQILNSDPSFKNVVQMQSVRQQVDMLLDEIISNHVMMFSSLPVKSENGKEYQHALDTSILAILIAQKFNYTKRELRFLGTAGLLHDIGKLPFKNLAEKEWEVLTAEEKFILREHPSYSMMILRGSEVNTFVEQTAVLQHHEHLDGSGYPQRLKGVNTPPRPSKTPEAGVIYRFAEILAVANEYDRLISGFVDGKKYSPSEAISKMIGKVGNWWNSHALKALTQVVQHYPVGCCVRIRMTSSHKYAGYSGIVSESNEDEQNKPVIVLYEDSVGGRITPRKYDLSREKLVHLEMIL